MQYTQCSYCDKKKDVKNLLNKLRLQTNFDHNPSQIASSLCFGPGCMFHARGDGVR